MKWIEGLIFIILAVAVLTGIVIVVGVTIEVFTS